MKYNIKTIQKLLSTFIKGLFEIFIDIIHISVTIIYIVGAIVSLILLIKLFPETAILITNPLYSIFRFIFQIIKGLLYLILILGSGYFAIVLYDFVNIFKKKRKINCEKFLNELAKKLNRKRSKK